MAGPRGGLVPPLPDGLPGWQAFRVATCAVAVTTILFIPVSVWAVWSGSRAVYRAFARVATFAFVVDAHWYVLYGASARQDLRIGYFLWWLSFLLVALGLFDLPRRETKAIVVFAWPKALKVEL